MKLKLENVYTTIILLALIIGAICMAGCTTKEKTTVEQPVTTTTATNLDCYDESRISDEITSKIIGVDSSKTMTFSYTVEGQTAQNMLKKPYENLDSFYLNATEITEDLYEFGYETIRVSYDLYDGNDWIAHFSYTVGDPSSKKFEDYRDRITTVPTVKETGSQINAIRKADDYLRYMAFSRQGLIEQLEYEGFSKSDAIYGADNTGANWNEQASKKADDYLQYMAFSRQGLIEQLEYEGFTHAQAVYGVDNCGTNW